MNVLLEIWKDKLSDYVIMDYILKIWVTVLLVMVVLGLGTIISHIIMNPSAIDNATFGIFDTLGS
jgi:hypothetical protein